jgi:hypothetical protein
MRFSYLTILFLIYSISGYCQSLHPYFPSRLIYQVLTPQVIRDNNVKTVKIYDHWYDRTDFKYIVSFNPKGVMRNYVYVFDHGIFAFISKHFRVDPFDTIFYNRTKIKTISKKNSSISIDYDQNGKIKVVSYQYNSPILCCAVICISIEYNTDRTIKDDVLNTTSEFIKSTYNYEDKLITNVNSVIIKKNDDKPYAKDTIYENYKINYYPSGLLKSIVSSSDSSRYFSYNYEFRK